MAEQPLWIVMPILADPEKTEAAISDCLAQSIPTRLLLINQGVEEGFRDRLERIAESHADRVLVWSHQPPLLSLAATWNRALRFVWEAGGTEALVVNNDVRLHPDTVRLLDGVMGHTEALFVSAVGVRAEEFDPLKPIDDAWLTPPDDRGLGHPLAPGGPDFSCFLISRSCHDRFLFDEHFVPAFCEDLDYHRRLLLAGEGARIFSVNLPYLHYGSNTLQRLEPRHADAIRQQIEMQSRRYYQEKWGGPVNRERFLLPFGGDAGDNITGTTPYLQAHVDETGAILTRLQQRYLGGQGNYRETEEPWASAPKTSS